MSSVPERSRLYHKTLSQTNNTKYTYTYDSNIYDHSSPPTKVWDTHVWYMKILILMDMYAH